MRSAAKRVEQSLDYEYLSKRCQRKVMDPRSMSQRRTGCTVGRELLETLESLDMVYTWYIPVYTWYIYIICLKQIPFLDDQTRIDASMDSLHTALHARWRWTEPVQGSIELMNYVELCCDLVIPVRKVLLWCGLKLVKMGV